MMDAYRMLDRTSQVILVQGDASCVNKEAACQSALESDALFVPSTTESSAEKKKEQT